MQMLTNAVSSLSEFGRMNKIGELELTKGLEEAQGFKDKATKILEKQSRLRGIQIVKITSLNWTI